MGRPYARVLPEPCKSTDGFMWADGWRRTYCFCDTDDVPAREGERERFGLDRRWASKVLRIQGLGELLVKAKGRPVGEHGLGCEECSAGEKL